jgi:hypothetical protein
MARGQVAAAVMASFLALLLVSQLVFGLGSASPVTPFWNSHASETHDGHEAGVNTSPGLKLEKEIKMEVAAGDQYLIGAGRADITG